MCTSERLLKVELGVEGQVVHVEQEMHPIAAETEKVHVCTTSFWQSPI